MSLTIGAALKATRSALAEILDERDADREARLILARITGRSQASLIADPDSALESDAHETLNRILSARLDRQPLSQILGEVEFYGRPFHVTPDVLTPRADTETLVDIALSEPFAYVLDLATGSGCILATLLAERTTAKGMGTDLSTAALDVAARNVDRHGMADRATLQRSDWFAEVEGQFDLIVSNPPYIAEVEMPDLAPEVRDWEPHMALSPGDDGLAAYRTLTTGAAMHLSPRGRLMVEIGYSQGPAVYQLFEEAGLDQVLLHTDMSGKDRVVEGRLP
ncbi:peptide chain release factor N(5)-glutamine methyltransferase [Gymnodinialimonas hymeniacidonis]|uniref:peptide chain release factor N(5)-glutamine methyltransferase n=1 Tax=Gymnodinialimonas hymeniacidonis TaxID=3126508 RepID=UPI0034C5DCF0